MSIYTDEFNALNSLIGALGNDSISPGNSYELARIQQLQKINSIFNLGAIANGQSIAFNSTTKKFTPATFALDNHVHAIATTSANGFMSSADKTKLDAIELNGGSVPAHTHALATTSADGFMSSADKTKLDGINLSGYAPLSHTHDYSPSNHTHALATTSANGFMSSVDKTKLDSITVASLATLNSSNTFTKAQRSQVVTLSISGGTVTLNPNDSNDFLLELSSSATLTISGGTASDSFRLTVVQTAIGGRILSLPAGTKMQGGIAPTYSTAPGAIDKLYFDTHNGTTWCCSFANFS